MTIAEAKKQAMVRRKRVAPGNMRRGPRGEWIMDFVAEFSDPGAPEFAVTGVASIERVGAAQVRVSKCSHRRDGVVVVFHEIWDLQTYLRASRAITEALEIIAKAPPDGVGPRKPDGRRSPAH